MSDKTKVVWREWFNEPTIEKLTKMGTLPRNEIELSGPWIDGEDLAREIAEAVNREDFEAFRGGCEITILEPEQFAGDYEIHVEYEPVFSAYEMT